MTSITSPKFDDFDPGVPSRKDSEPDAHQSMAAFFQEKARLKPTPSDSHQLPAVAPLSSDQPQKVAQATAACAKQCLLFGRQNSTSKAIGATILLGFLALLDAILYLFAFDSLLSILPNLKESFQNIWSNPCFEEILKVHDFLNIEEEREKLIQFLQNPWLAYPSEEQRRSLIDIAENYTTLQKELPRLPSSQKKFLQACFASAIPLFQIPRSIYCKDPAEFAAHPQYADFQQSLKVMNKKHNKGQLKAEIELNGRSATKTWDLPFRAGVKIPEQLAKDINRQFTSITICPRTTPPILVISNKVIDDLLQPEEANNPLEDSSTAVQRQALNLLMPHFYDFSSMQGVESVDATVLTSISQNGPVANFTMSCGYGLSMGMLQSKIGFRNRDLSTEIHDVNETEIRIVYTGVLNITNGARQDAPSIGSINYRMTLVWKKEGDQWVDVSYATDPKDGRQISFQDFPVFFQRVEDVED